MNYNETAIKLFEILTTCNAADSDNAESWQRAGDASFSTGAYGDVNRALVKLVGRAAVDHWCETGEIDPALFCRQPEKPNTHTHTHTHTLPDTAKARAEFFVYVACDTDNIRLDNLTLDQARVRVHDYMTWRSVRSCRIDHMYDVCRDYNDADIIIDCRNPDSN